MNAERFNWKERSQLVGGIAIVALIQAGLLFPDTRDFIGSWVVMTLFGVIYASDRRRNEKRRRPSKME